MFKNRTRLGARLKSIVVGLATASAATVALVTPAATSPAYATGAEGFLFLAPGFTQTLWGTHPDFLGGLAFATNGDVLADHCAFTGSSLADYSQTSTTMLNGSTLHNHTELAPSNAGCGLTNHPDGTLYTNTGAGVVNLDASTGAQLRGPFGPPGRALGIATDPLTGNLDYVGQDPGENIDFVNSAFTASGTFSTADPGALKDQITWSPDGKFLFISHRTPSFDLMIVDRSGALVQDVPMNHEPDGIAFHAVAPQFVVTNNTDGTMTRFDFPGNDYTAVPAQSDFATGGFRGDMTVVGSDGCLYVTQDGTRYANGVTTPENSILQICGGFAPPPGLKDAAISAKPVTFNATEGSTFSGTVATFHDPDAKSTASEYSATIDWGDGSPTTTGTITQTGCSNSGCDYNVDGSHLYAEEGTYRVTVTITDVDNTSNSETVTSTALVADAALTSSCAMPPVIAQAYAGPTATFKDSSSTGTPSDFSATINWGDSTTTSGTIAGGPGNAPYTVSGSHTYSSTGTFTVTTTVNDVGGQSTTASCSVIVFAFPTSSGATFVIGDLAPTGAAPPLPGNHVTWWSSQWATLNPMSGGPPPPSMKGFAGFEDNASGLPPQCGPGQNWTTDPGNSTPPPATVPDVMGVIVSSHVDQNGSVISGDIKEIVIVKNDPGYAPDPGHQGTGTVLAILCTS